MQLSVRSGATLTVNGELRGVGTAAQPLQLTGGGMIVSGGMVSVEHATVAVRIDRGSRGVVRVAHGRVSTGYHLSSFARDSLLVLEDVEVTSGWPAAWGQLALDGVEFLNPGFSAELVAYRGAGRASTGAMQWTQPHPLGR